MTALAGIKVLDFTRMHSGPFASMILADLGATVVKIEPPVGDETRRMTRFSYGDKREGELSAFFAASNRNKHSLVLDLNDPDCRGSLDQLLAEADVVIDNFRPSTLQRLDLGYEHLTSLNPDVISVSVTGYGEGSPEADSPAYDLLAQARSGLMSITGDPGTPPMKCGSPIGDLVAGVYAAVGALAALHERETTGKGQRVEVAMLDAQIAMVHYHYGYFDASGVVLPKVGSEHQNMVPYGIFECEDGHLAIAAVPQPPKFWHELCAVLGHPEWRDDPRFESADARHVNRDALRAEMEAVLTTRTRREWFEALRDGGIPVAPVNELDDLATDEQVGARDMLVELEHAEYGALRLPGNPIKMRGALPIDQWTAPPLLGELEEPSWPGIERADADPPPFDANLLERRASGEWVLLAWDCDACDRVSFGRGGHCPACGSDRGRATTLQPAGSLETWSKIESKRESYIVGYAQLGVEGKAGAEVRVFGRVDVDDEAALELGMPVDVRFAASELGGSLVVHHSFAPAQPILTQEVCSAD